MKPWLIKFLFMSGSAILLITGLGLYANRASVNLSGFKASVLDTIVDAEIQSEADQSEPDELTESIDAAESAEAPAETAPEITADLPPEIVPIPPVVVFSAPAPAFISIPSLGFGSAPAQGGQGGGSVSQSAAAPSSTNSQLEISVSASSPIPETASSTPSATSSTPEVSFICTPDAQPHLVIKELYIDMVGADTQESIKLYNPGDHDVSLASSSLQYLAGTASGIDKIAKKNFSASSTIPAQSFYLIGMGDYAGASVDMLWSQSLSNTGASILLVGNTDLITGIDDSDILDRVAYGTGTLMLADLPMILPPPGQTLIHE